MKKLTTNQFIEKAKQVHNNVYDYSLVEYVNNSTKVKIICSIHGMFEQTPNAHLSNRGCNLCGHTITNNKTRFLKDQFIEKAKQVPEKDMAHA